MIQTPYEISGEFATSAEGQQFMVDLAADTGQELISIGKSFNDNELYCLKMGQGEDVLLLVSGVHRSEPASREMLMMKTRDMAYNADGNYTDFLSKYTVYSLPTLNPDALYRNNAQGININRDLYGLETPEAAAIARLMSTVKPKVFVDFHERAGMADKVEFVNPWKIDPNVQKKVFSLSKSSEGYIKSELSAKGIANGDYPSGGIGTSSTTNAAMNLGMVSFTPETFLEALPDFRISSSKEVFEATLTWFDNNIVELREMSDVFNSPIKPTDNMFLFNGSNEYITSATLHQIQTPEGYIVDDIESFSKWIYAYNLEVDEFGFLPINQRAGRLLVHLLDPLSDLKVASATRVEPIRRLDGRYTKVLYDGWREVFIKNFSER